MNTHIPFIVLTGAALLLASCAHTEEGREKSARRLDTSESRYLERVDLALEPPAQNVATIQLYRGVDETALPILAQNGSEPLTLEFDLMENSGRPLRIAFRHATRSWNVDYIPPSEFMSGFQHDEINDYRVSVGTRVPYVHYTYSFPNVNVGFRLSGNYILEVTDPRNKDAVLFERIFLVTEQTAAVTFDVRPVPVPGGSGIWQQPLAVIDPPEEARNDVFDFKTCFVRNTRFDLARCSPRPNLFDAPLLNFYLEPEVSFQPEADYRTLDLREVRTGNQIVEVDLGSDSIHVVLDYDQADLGSRASGLFQNGQSAISSQVRGIGNADIGGDYVWTTFRFIPFRQEQAAGEVLVTGSFNGWLLDPANRLKWSGAEKMYSGKLLLKQGVHEYQYHISGARRRSQGVFNPENLYSALVYYFDPRLNTDRLVGVRSVIAR
jgi:hypothetical protein